jgi:DNA-binding MarR family transcriptional regulator
MSHGPVAPAPESTELAARLRLSATRLARRLRRESGSGLTPSLLSALAVAERYGPLTLGELADREGVAPPSVTKLVNRLEADGLVDRRPCTDDRRVARVAVTASGRELVEETRQRRTSWLAGRIAELDDEQRLRLAAALDVLDELAGGGERW